MFFSTAHCHVLTQWYSISSEFVPAYVLFDSSWQKSLPKRRIYEPSTSQESSSPASRNIPTLNKEMKETREKMIELQRKWSHSDRTLSMEDFLQSGLINFREEKAKCNGIVIGMSRKHVSCLSVRPGKAQTRLLIYRR